MNSVKCDVRNFFARSGRPAARGFFSTTVTGAAFGTGMKSGATRFNNRDLQS
jgi:hypothetical protein